METGYTFPSITLTYTAGKKKYETNAKVVNTLLGSLSQSKFVKVMQLKTAKEIWDKIVLSYEGDDKIVNYMKNLGEEIKEVVMVEKVLRSLSSKFDSKVSAIEEKQDLQSITMSQLHGILTAYEIRKGGPSYRREVAFKASGKGDYDEYGHMSEGEEESNFVKNLQRGTGRFIGKLPFKCFTCGRVGHYVAKCPHKDKGKEPVRWNIKQNVNKKSYYTHEDNDGFSNSDEDEQCNDDRLLMAFEDDDFLDAIDEEGLYEEISKLKICLEEKNMIIDTLTFQLAEREKHNEKRLGHLSFSQIRKACKYQVVHDLPDIRIPDNTICKSCQFGKQTRTNFTEKEGSASRPLELVHTDICGPTRKRSPRGEEYFILFIDDFSRMCCIGLMKYKDEAFEKFKTFKALVENESDHRIKCLRSDRGGEFISDEFFDFCKEHGIRREFSTARTPKKNGVVERMNRMVQQMACAMLDESGTHATF
eukprot:PITA_33627